MVVAVVVVVVVPYQDLLIPFSLLCLFGLFFIPFFLLSCLSVLSCEIECAPGLRPPLGRVFF